MSVQTDFSERLGRVLDEKGITTDELQKRVGHQKSTWIVRWLRGDPLDKAAVPRVDVLRKIAEVLNVEMSVLLPEGAKAKPTRKLKQNRVIGDGNSEDQLKILSYVNRKAELWGFTLEIVRELMQHGHTEAAALVIELAELKEKNGDISR